MSGIRRVYAIQHRHTGRIYVGSTTKMLIEGRIMQHLYALRGGRHTNALMQEDYNKYGEDYDFFDLGEYEDQFSSDPWAGRRPEYEYMEKFGTDNPEIGYNGNDPYFKRKKELNIKKCEPIPNSITFTEEE